MGTFPQPLTTQGGGIPPDLEEEEPDYSGIPLEERLKDKRWQVRLRSYY